MCTRTTQIKSINRHAVGGKSLHRARRKQLVECHCAMEDISVGQPKDALQIQGRQALSCDDACLEAWRIRFKGLYHKISDSLPMLLPGRAVSKLRAYMLAE